LHVSIIFTAALICHYVIPSRTVRYSLWVYWVLTTISTIYFGWHYILDDIAGFGIGLFAVWVGAKTTGHRMEVRRHQAAEGDGLVGVFPPDLSPAQGSGERLDPVAAAVVASAGSSDDAAEPSIPKPAAERAGTTSDERPG
jgi:hypothetical protein